MKFNWKNPFRKKVAVSVSKRKRKASPMPEWKRDLRDVSLQHEYLIYSTSVKNMGGTPSSIERYAKRRAEGQRIRLKQQKEAAAAKAAKKAKEAEEYQAYLTKWKLNNPQYKPMGIIDLYTLPHPTSPGSVTVPKVAQMTMSDLEDDVDIKIGKTKRNPKTGRFEKKPTPIASTSSVPSGAAFIYGKPASTRNLENAQNILIASAKLAYEPKPLSLAEFAKQKEEDTK
jgi:hypothetical protein